LGGEHRTNQRTRASDSGEVVAEQDPFVRWVIVAAVAQLVRGRGTAIVEHRHARGEEHAVISVGHHEGGERAKYQPKRIHGAAASVMFVEYHSMSGGGRPA